MRRQLPLATVRPAATPRQIPAGHAGHEPATPDTKARPNTLRKIAVKLKNDSSFRAAIPV